MPNIEWVSTLDNSSFVASMRQMQDSMRQTSQAIQSIGSNFNISNIVDQYISLTKVIQDNEVAIKSNRDTVVDWMKKAEEARNAGDFGLFDSMQVDIADKLNEIEQLTRETDEYKQSLNEILGLWGNLGGQKAPLLFDTQEAYDKAQQLKEEIAHVQEQIANWSGSDDVLEALRGNLSNLEEDLRNCELAAAKNAESLGAAGSIAAEASNHYYELTNKIKEQEAIVGELTIKYQEAAEEYKKVLGGGSTQDIMDARAKMDAFAKGLDTARHSLISLKTEQSEFHKKMQQMSKGVSEAGSEIIGVFKNIAAVAGVSFTLNQAKQFVNEVVSIRSAMQDLETSMNIFLGGEEKAAAFNEQLKNYSMHSLFHYNELIAVSRQLLALGMDADDAMKKMDQLANIAAATHASLSTVASMYQRAQTMGSVMNRQLVTWQNLGVNVKGVLKEMGEEVTKSTVSFEQLDKVINHVTAPGGKFANAQESMLGNISAEIDTYKNKMELMFNEIGEQYQDYITGVIKGGQWMIDHYKEIGTLIMDVIAAYGTYRAALVAVAAAHKVSAFWENASAVATRINTAAKAGQATAVTTSTVAWRLATVSIKENTAAMLSNAAAAITNPYVLLGAAVAALTFTVYKLATADDAETAARKRANEEAQKFADLMEERKNKINSLISVLNDETATASQQARAWEELRKIAPTLTEGYTQAEFAAMSLDEAQKELNKDSEDFELEHAREEVNKLKKNFEELKLQYEAQKGLSADAIDFNNYVNKKDVDEAAESLRLAEEALKKLEEAKSKASEPKKIDDLGIKELLDGYEEASEKIDEINGKKVDVNINSQLLLDAVGWAKGLETELMGLNESDVKPDVSSEEIEKAKDEALGAISELKSLDMQVADPNVKREKIEEAEKKVKAVRDKLLSVDKITAKPSVAITGIDKAISKLKEAWDYLKKLLGKGEGDKPQTATNNNGQTASKNDYKTKIANMVDKVKSDAEVNKYLKELNAKKEKATYGSEERAFYDEQIKILQDKKKLNDDHSKEDNKRAKERQEKNAREIREQQQHNELMLKLKKDAADAQEKAMIAAIADDAERIRQERSFQHKKEIEDIKKQEDEVYKTIYNERKKAYENANKEKGLKYENTKEGKAGWQALKTTTLKEAQNLEKSILTELGKGDIMKAVQEQFGQGNVDVIARPMIDAANLVKAGWKNAGDGIATVFSMQEAIVDSEGNRREILFTPILPDGTVMSPSEIQKYLHETLEGAKDILEADSKGLVISVGEVGFEGDLGGDALHKLHEELINIPIDKLKEIQQAFANINKANLSADEQKQVELVKNAVNSQIAEKESTYSREDKQQEQQRIEQLVASHQSYVDRKKALDKKYSNDIKAIDKEITKAEKEGNTERAEALKRSRAQALKDYASEQSKISLDQLKEMPEYIEAFEDLDKVSSETLQDLIDMFNKVKNEQAKSLAPTEIKEYMNIIEQMQDKLRERDPFGNLVKSAKALSQSKKDLKKATSDYTKVANGEKVLVWEINKETKKMEAHELTLEEAKKKKNDAQKKYNKTQKEYDDALEENIKNVDELANQISNLGNVIGGTMGSILGLAAQITTAVTSSITGIKALSKTGEEAISAVEKASVIIGIISTALQVLTAIFDLFGESEEEKKQREKRIEMMNTLTASVINYRMEIMKAKLAEQEWFSSTNLQGLASQWMSSQKALIEYEDYLDNFWEKYRQSIGVTGNTGYSYDDTKAQVNAWFSDNKEREKELFIFNENSRAESLVDFAKRIYKDDLFGEDGVLNVELAKKIIEDFGDQLIGSAEETLKELSALAEEYKKWQESLKSYISDLYSPLADDLTDALWDSAENGTDAMKSFENSARSSIQSVGKEMIKSLINVMLFEELKEKLKGIYTEYAKMMAAANNTDNEEEKKRQIEAALDFLRNGVGNALQGFKKTTEDSLPTLQSITNDIYNTIDGIFPSSEVLESHVDAIKNAFSDLLSDPTQNIEEWGKNFRNALIKELIQNTILGKEYEEWAKEWNEKYTNLYNAFKNGEIDEAGYKAGLDALMSDFNGMADSTTQRAKEMMEQIGFIFDAEELDSPFSGLRDTFLDTLTNMEDDADAFKKRLEEIMVKDLIEKQVLDAEFTINGMTFENFDAYITDWNKRYIEAVKSGNQAAIDALIEELVQARELTAQAAEELRDRLKKVTNDETFKGMSDNFVSALMDMNKTAEDWATDLGRVMAEKIIKEMIVPTMIQPLLDNLQDVFNGVMDKAVTTDENGQKHYDWQSVIGSEELMSEINKISAEYPEIQAVIKQIMEAFGLSTTNYKYSGFSNLGDTILASLADSEDSIEEWASDMGKSMAQQMAQAYIDSTYGKHIKELNEEWQKALQDGNQEAMASIQESLEALYKAIGADETLQGLIDKFKTIENPFKDMASTFVSSLMDMNASAEDFANSISKMLTEQMINKIITEGYQTQIDTLGEQWREALESGDSAAIERITQRLTELRGEMGEAVQPLLDAISDINKETDKTFSNMTDSWVSALMNMEGTAEEFAESVGKTMAQKIISEMIAPVYIQPILDAMQNAYNAAVKVQGATVTSVVQTMLPYIEQIKGIYGEIQPMIADLFGQIGITATETAEDIEEIQYALQDMKSNFVSTLMDMKSTTQDFSQDISKILAQSFIEKFLLGDAFDARMKQWQEQYESILGSGMSEDERKKQLRALRDSIATAREDYTKQAIAIQELLGITTEDAQAATMNMADKITYDQADQLLGVNIAQELLLEQILAVMLGTDSTSTEDLVGNIGEKVNIPIGELEKNLAYKDGELFDRVANSNAMQSEMVMASMQALSNVTQVGQDNILLQIALANSHLELIRDYSKNIRDEVLMHLGSIDSKLTHLREL